MAGVTFAACGSRLAEQAAVTVSAKKGLFDIGLATVTDSTIYSVSGVRAFIIGNESQCRYSQQFVGIVLVSSVRLFELA
ncbi:hypothetical protein N9V90_02820 [Endozoicomonas sp.]|nr:hypothetical protein [Endozoicomonas sp.]